MTLFIVTVIVNITGTALNGIVTRIGGEAGGVHDLPRPHRHRRRRWVDHRLDGDDEDGARRDGDGDESDTSHWVEIGSAWLASFTIVTCFHLPVA